MGADVLHITTLVSEDFLKLVTLAIFIAGPIAYYFMDKWLQDFAYRIHIEWWVFALAGFLVLLSAFATISIQTINAAFANPVNSLRSQ